MKTVMVILIVLKYYKLIHTSWGWVGVWLLGALFLHWIVELLKAQENQGV
jgi:hypothetical protein